jgi:hypothetical protein
MLLLNELSLFLPDIGDSFDFETQILVLIIRSAYFVLVDELVVSVSNIYKAFS